MDAKSSKAGAGRESVLVWFREDLRLQDNPALAHAVESGASVVPVFVWAPQEEGEWAPGAASRWWLHHSLAALDGGLQARGLRLIVREGASLAVLRALVKETGAAAVFWNRRYDPSAVARDTGIKRALMDEGVEVRSFNGTLLHAPTGVVNQSGGPYRVFTPFWRQLESRPVREETVLAEGVLRGPDRWPESVALGTLGLLPDKNWAEGFAKEWEPGERGAQAALEHFLAATVQKYGEGRDRPDRRGTSRLSPHLHFGEISAVQVYHAVKANGGPGAARYLSEIGWREFAQHLLFHFPRTPTEPLRDEFARFPWRRDEVALRCWCRGRTGYPIVDAAMRELWQTGWMHNRARMIVASFLVKHLRISWVEGARWFWDTLVDADLANNTLGWQWSAGCGADAAPYFRIFNPVLQGRKFDPDGAYVRRFVPELARLPVRFIHAPWEASASLLAAAGVRLGVDYPQPCVDHAQARAEALAAFAGRGATGPARVANGAEDGA